MAVSQEAASTTIYPGGLQRVPPVKPGFVRFRAVKRPDVGLVAELDGPVVTVDGTGTDQLTERPGRVSITSEGGTPPLALRIPLLLDRWREQRSVEREIKMLERMLGVGGDQPKRPQVTVEGPGIPHSYERNSKLRWRLSEPEWATDDIRYVNDSARAYVQVSVLARAVVRPDTVPVPEERVTEGAKGRFFFRTTSETNTLREVSKYVGVSLKELKGLNEDRKPKLPNDPDKKLPRGSRLRID